MRGLKVGFISSIAVCAIFLFASSSYAYVDPVLKESVPSELKVDASGNQQKIDVYGDGFEDMGHSDRDEYMHWQIRLNGGEWKRCSRLSSVNPDCYTNGWTGGMESFVIGGNYVSHAGYIELRLFHGLALNNAVGPDQLQPNWSWSNVLRIPVVSVSANTTASNSVPASPIVIKKFQKPSNVPASNDATVVPASTAVIKKLQVAPKKTY